MEGAAPSGTCSASWQRALDEAIGDVARLLAELQLEAGCGDDQDGRDEAARRLPLRVPLPFVRRMGRGDPDDPLLRQVLPSGRELAAADGFAGDPLGERSLLAADGTLQKYRGRLLITVTSGCAVHCRYCFRRNLRLSGVGDGDRGFEPAVARVASDPEVDEVILSGGDPLTLDDGVLAGLVQELAAIPHLRRLRVHTRVPVVIPERVCDRLLAWLSGTRLRSALVIHANHPGELDRSVERALAMLADAGVTLLNQSVLLKGVNDEPGTLAELSRRLFACRVLPYYLHLLDRVHGAAHFEVAEPTARRLVEEMAVRLPGYLVPRLVREWPGAPYKVPMMGG
jgi:EF-P beta-lysylation protein EpmB